MSEQDDKIIEIYEVLCDLRYVLHKEMNTIDDYKKSFDGYYQRVARAARDAEDLLPTEYQEQLRKI